MQPDKQYMQEDWWLDAYLERLWELDQDTYNVLLNMVDELETDIPHALELTNRPMHENICWWIRSTYGD